MKATEQYFPVVVFTMLYKVFLTLSLWMKSYSVTMQKNLLSSSFLCHSTVYYAVQDGANF